MDIRDSTDTRRSTNPEIFSVQLPLALPMGLPCERFIYLWILGLKYMAAVQGLETVRKSAVSCEILFL